MTLRFHCLWVAALLASLPNAPLLAARRPNVILIMTDDQGYGDFSRHGNPVLRTPTLDTLAAQSIRLTDFHVAPICTPTRGQLLTGLDALRNGATSATGQRHLLKRGLPTMGDIFRAGGYRTALYGKWHLGGNFVDFRPHERGFEDAVHFLRGGVQSHPNPFNSDLMNDELYHNGRLETFPGYATDVWFDLGAKFVRQCTQRGEPFFLYLPLNAPHGPYLVPDHYRRPYQHLNKVVATFFGMIASVDYRMREFLALLEELGVADNTILIFLTDNGTAEGQGVHNAGMRGKKGSLYEGGHRVPCWLRWPAGKLRPPGDVNALTECQDLLPTLIDLCGLTPAKSVRFDGVSLAPLLRGQPQPALDERMLVVQRAERKGPATVMWRRWRLVEGELYDLAQDPGQKSDVAMRHPEIAARMKAHYEQWWAGVEPHLTLEPYRLGVAGEPLMLTAYDWWHGRQVPNWPHIRRGQHGNGRYQVTIERAGEYELCLRRWPRESGLGIRAPAPRYVPFDPFMAGDEKIEHFPPGEALDIVQARVKFGDQVKTAPVAGDVQEVSLTFRLPAGPTQLQTWFIDVQGREFGAYYVYVTGPDAKPAATGVLSSFVLFDLQITHRGDRQLYSNWDFQTHKKTNPAAPMNWREGEPSLFDAGIYHWRVEVVRMERPWQAPMTLQFGWWNLPKDPVIRHIACPALLLTHLEPPAPGRPWVYELVGKVRALDVAHMYYGKGPNQDKRVTDWDWSRAFAPDTAYTLVNPRKNDLDSDGDGKISAAEYSDLEIRTVLTLHRPESPAYESLRARLPKP